MKPKNVFNWVEIPTNDFDRAVMFYSEILGDSINVNNSMGMTLGFFPMDPASRDGSGGDIVQPSPDHKPSANGARAYLNAEGRIDEILNRVEHAGGKIIKEKSSIGKAGWIALISDSEGNTIGLHSFK